MSENEGHPILIMLIPVVVLGLLILCILGQLWR